MELEYKPDWEQTKRRIEAFWNGEIFDRPLLSITAPNGKQIREIPEPKTMKERCLNFDYRLDVQEERIRCTYFAGEAIPTLWPDFGPDFTAACLGGNLRIGETTKKEISGSGAMWSVPVIEDWEKDLPKIKFDPENVWWRRGVEFTNLAIERSKGKYLVVIPDVDGGGDTCAALRETKNLCIDLYDHPKWVHRLVDIVSKANIKIVEGLYAILSRYGKGNISTFKIWAPGRFYNIRSDFAYNISPEQYREFFLRGAMRESEYLDYSIYHMHWEDYESNQKNRLAHLDAILSIPKLNGVGGIMKPEVCQKILSVGKFIFLHSPLKDIPKVIESLGPKRIWLTSEASTPEEADAVVRGAYKKRM